MLRRGEDAVLLATGTMVSSALEAASRLDAIGVRTSVVNCRFLKPFDRKVFEEAVQSHPVVITLEEGQITNGFGSFMAREIAELDLASPPRVSALGIPDDFIEHGNRDVLLEELDLDPTGIARRVQVVTGVGAELETA